MANRAGKQLLSQAFSELYVQAPCDSLSVADADVHTTSGWEWINSAFLFDSSVDSELAQQLRDNIQHIVSELFSHDTFSWDNDYDENFPVNSYYRRFKPHLSGPPLDHALVQATTFLWKVKAPP